MLIIVASVLASAITSKIVAAYYFKKVDGYVKEMCEMTTKNNKDTLTILHKLSTCSVIQEQERTEKVNSCVPRR